MRKTMSLLKPTFIIHSISIGIVESASCLNFGNNFPMEFQSEKKQNQGFGNVTGNENTLSELKTLLSDKGDFRLASENGEEIPEWLQVLMDKKMEES